MKQTVTRFAKTFALSFMLLFSSQGLVYSEHPDFDARAITTEILQKAQQGGLVIYMRHGATDTNIPDQVPIDLNDCATQRPLTQAGLDEAKQIGHGFRQLNIPFSKVYSSPLCRAIETAQATFQTDITVDENLKYTAALTTAEKQPIIARTFELLSKPVAPGTNRILVAHGPNLVETMKYFPPEGTLVFFKPLGNNQFEYLASITPDDWKTLLKTLGLKS